MVSKLAMTEDIRNCGLKATEGTLYYRVLKIGAVISFLVMIVAQFAMMFLFSGEQISDSILYMLKATQCAENGLWFPSVEDLMEPYINGNGLINFMALIMRITSDVRVFFFFNILFVQMMFWSCLYILQKTFRRKTICFWFAILFCLLNTFWSYIAQINSDIPFTALAFVGLALLYSGKKWSYPAAGVILALANWIRPIALAFLIGALCLCIFNRKKLRHVLALLGGYGAVILIIGCISFANCGHFVYQAVTLGYNLIMTSHDDADGSYMNLVGEGQVAYIDPEQKENMTFLDYDEYYTRKSLEWIKKNPWGYLKLIPAKLFYLYSTDTYAGAAYFHNAKSTSGIAYIKSLANKFTGNSDDPLQIGDILITLNQIWYMIICVLFSVGLVYLIRKKQWRCMLPLWISMFCGTGITIVIVGAARYHFPYLPVMMIGAAFACECMFAGEKS